ncbi:ABC transporter ATP-binding protein [Alkalihalophilus marmarensis]|uniref:Spermidine/putrescine ABC transporter ATP-binding protein n=1 Tax=Alkalihalophilus marmarensis DSM 21297 TaxID=1188261 RepID=U6SSF0_9BACI|nr:ABC transporter ATP-binding protein [Alkalihalophilus marmarensis]ERN54548.1 spermidine/putrescine ABC transporter ATP-binding protein [Alkalihalophilus marmarensis DSM 21297]
MITFNNVSKKYMTKTALKDINIELNKGKIIGLVGENGSGKSTTLKLIAGLIQPSKGSVIVNGQEADRRIAKDVTYLSELDEYYSFYNVGQTIEFYASQFPDFNLVKAEEIREFMKLDKNTKLKHLSKGNRGRLKLILTLSRDVPVILLDEPFSGLDPMVRDSIVQGLISFVDLEKQIILITTHEIKEVEMILDEVIAIKDGQFIGHHNVEDLRYTQNMSIVEWMKTLYNE